MSLSEQQIVIRYHSSKIRAAKHGLEIDLSLTDTWYLHDKTNNKTIEYFKTLEALNLFLDGFEYDRKLGTDNQNT